MSALLKAAHVVATLPVARPEVVEPVPDPRDAIIDALRQEVAQLHAAARQGAATQDERIADAVARAERRARDAAQRDDSARTALLEKALNAARAALDERLALLDRLAPALARVVLDRMFAAAEERATLVEAMLVRRLAEFHREAVVAVVVSAADIEAAALTDLAARLGGVTLRHDPLLTGGQCRIEARYEALPLDLGTEWAVLAGTLDAMVEGRA